MDNVYLVNTILRLCKQPRSFEYISKNLGGLDPVEAKTLLTKMEEQNHLVQINNLWSIPDAGSMAGTLELFPGETKLYLQRYMGYYDFLKTPHPLDFEWRNSSFSLNRLLNKLATLTSPSDKLLFLGMPTLFAAAIHKDIPNTVRLIERNTPIIQGLNKINTDPGRFQTQLSDIFTVDPQSVGTHYCVMMDPPWYTPHFFQFMWLAAKCITVGGFVAISLPPISTRPNIMGERLEWFSFCKDLGLCIETIDAQQLQYAMPFFEFNALRAAGIDDILPFWRKGDLAIFRKVSEVSIRRPSSLIANEDWQEREYNDMRLRIKIDKCDSKADLATSTVRIESLIKADILPTVSSRDPRRADAKIWTSGNRIFGTNNAEKVLADVDAILKGKDLTEEQLEIKALFDTISKFEKEEFQNYLQWIYYEMERQTD